MVSPDRSFPNGTPVCDYWLSRCEGFTVRAGHRTLGVVERVAHGRAAPRADAIVLRRRGRRLTLDAAQVLAVVPARQVVLARRREVAKPIALRTAHAGRTGVELAAPVVASGARRGRALVLRLARRLAAEIRDRNEHHGPEPAAARDNPNAYSFALSTRGR